MLTLTYQCLLLHISHTVAIEVNDTRLGLQWTNLAHFSKDLCRKDIDVKSDRSVQSQKNHNSL